MAGARQIQGTLNGLGERCGNANLTSIIPTLLMKEPYASMFEVGVSKEDLSGLTRVSRMLDDILNFVPNSNAPYVGSSAFTHKSGLHASAILKDPTTYEHLLPKFFDIERYRVSVERRQNARGEEITVSEAVVVTRVDGERMMSVSESLDPITEADQGPVNALSRALAKDLGRYQEYIQDIDLVDFRVRITNGGTEAVTRVHIDSEDSEGRHWSTVGVSANIVDASFQALHDAVIWKLIRDGARPQ